MTHTCCIIWRICDILKYDWNECGVGIWRNKYISYSNGPWFSVDDAVPKVHAICVDETDSVCTTEQSWLWWISKQDAALLRQGVDWSKLNGVIGWSWENQWFLEKWSWCYVCRIQIRNSVTFAREFSHKVALDVWDGNFCEARTCLHTGRVCNVKHTPRQSCSIYAALISDQHILARYATSYRLGRVVCKTKIRAVGFRQYDWIRSYEWNNVAYHNRDASF